MRSESSRCAACRHQHRPCPPDCILRPYFPREQSTEFHHAERIFGVGGIKKILQQVHPDLRELAANSIKYESYTLSTSPVHACFQLLLDLKTQTASSQFTTPSLNLNHFPSFRVTKFFSNIDYDDPTAFLDAHGALSLGLLDQPKESVKKDVSGETATISQAHQVLPCVSENEDFDDDLYRFLNSPTNGDQLQFHQTAHQSVTDAGGDNGNFAFGEPTINNGQQVLPNFNDILSSLTDNSNNNYDDTTDLFSFDFPYPTNHEIIQFVPSKETSDQSANYMPKDDGNPFA